MDSLRFHSLISIPVMRLKIYVILSNLEGIFPLNFNFLSFIIDSNLKLGILGLGSIFSERHKDAFFALFSLRSQSLSFPVDNTYGKSLYAYVEKTVILTGGRINLKENKVIQYTVEREYLAKFSVEELLIHIMKAHLNQDLAKNTMKK